VLTLANRLTILRILMTPAITILLLYKHMEAAVALFLLAGITDGLDGFVARRRASERRWAWSWTPWPTSCC